MAFKLWLVGNNRSKMCQKASLTPLNHIHQPGQLGHKPGLVHGLMLLGPNSFSSLQVSSLSFWTSLATLQSLINKTFLSIEGSLIGHFVLIAPFCVNSRKYCVWKITGQQHLNKYSNQTPFTNYHATVKITFFPFISMVDVNIARRFWLFASTWFSD